MRRKRNFLRELTIKQLTTHSWIVETEETDPEIRNGIVYGEEIFTSPQDLIVFVCEYYGIAVQDEDNLTASVLEV